VTPDERDPVNYSDPFGLCPSCGEGLFQSLLSTDQGYKDALAQARYDASMQLMWKTVGVMGLITGAGGAARAAVRDAAEGGAVGERALLGRNPEAGAGSNPRINTELPGGRATAKSIFRNLTKAEEVTQEQMSNGGVRRFAPDGTQVRFNPDGTTRLDVPRGPTGRETIHLDPQ
jgi:hypothetical protein